MEMSRDGLGRDDSPVCIKSHIGTVRWMDMNRKRTPIRTEYNPSSLECYSHQLAIICDRYIAFFS